MKALSLVLCTLFALAPDASFAGDAKAPPQIRHRHDDGKVSYQVIVTPGKAKSGETLFVRLSLSENLTQLDPKYGKKKPINDGAVDLFLVGPKSKKQAPVLSQRAIRSKDAGSYEASFTPKGDGVWGLYLRGTTPGGLEMAFETKIAVGVWPIEETAALPSLPVKRPAARVGNLAHGEALCAKHCRTDLAHAQPKGKTPKFIQSSFGAGLSRIELLGQVTKPSASSLNLVAKSDLAAYLRTLHLTAGELVTGVGTIMPAPMTLNKHALERLAAHGIKPTKAQTSGTVFVLYKGDDADTQTVKFSNRVARDRLDKKDKLGYVVFTSIPGEKRAHEVAIAIEREPSYQITAISARSATGKRDKKFQAELAKFVKQGKFNDPKSIKGRGTLPKKFMPVYLVAVELATAYLLNEREFTAFDDEFN